MTDQDKDIEYKIVTIHEFKTHMSRLLRRLEDGAYRALVIKRHKENIAMVVPMNKKHKKDRQEI